MPRRFTFRFETMLKIRRQREDHHKRVVAQRVGQIAQVRGEMAVLDRQITEQVQAIRSGQAPGTIDIQQALRHRHWLGLLNRRLLEGQARARFLEARLVQERAALAEAAKRRRILEKLKERQAERHRAEQDRRESRELDEIGTVRHVREGLAFASEQVPT